MRRFGLFGPKSSAPVAAPPSVSALPHREPASEFISRAPVGATEEELNNGRGDRYDVDLSHGCGGFMRLADDRIVDCDCRFMVLSSGSRPTSSKQAISPEPTAASS